MEGLEKSKTTNLESDSSHKWDHFLSLAISIFKMAPVNYAKQVLLNPIFIEKLSKCFASWYLKNHLYYTWHGYEEENVKEILLWSDSKDYEGWHWSYSRS